MKEKERLRNCDRLKKAKGTTQLNKRWDPGIIKAHSWGKTMKFQQDLWLSDVCSIIVNFLV